MAPTDVNVSIPIAAQETIVTPTNANESNYLVDEETKVEQIVAFLASKRKASNPDHLLRGLLTLAASEL